jgi:hypothetical protein
MDDIGMIRSQMGTHSVSEMGAVFVTPYAIPLHDSNNNSTHYKNNTIIFLFRCKYIAKEYLIG